MVPFRVFAPFAFGYFLSYLFRAVNAVAGPGISADLGVEPAALGLLTSVYFLTFAAIQLPLGVMLDRYPAHRVEAALLTIAAAGAVLFAVGGDVGTLTVGRALIGLGVSACLMAAFKAYSSMVRIERLPLVNGLHLAIGGLGLLSSGAPSEFAITLIGWRGLFWVLAGLSLAEAVVLLVFAATPRGPAGGATVVEQIRQVGGILSSRAFLSFAPMATAAQMTSLSIQSLWAGPWLREVAGYSPGKAATVLSIMAVATTIGFLLTGAIGAALARRGIAIAWGAAAGMTLFLVTQPAILLLPHDWAVGAWVAFAFLAASSSLGYPALTEAFAPQMSGRVNTGLNFLVFVMAFVVQWAVGVVVEAATPALGIGGGFALAFGLLIGIQALSIGWFLLRRLGGG